jgi:hypothetical protein
VAPGEKLGGLMGLPPPIPRWLAQSRSRQADEQSLEAIADGYANARTPVILTTALAFHGRLNSTTDYALSSPYVLWVRSIS